MSSEIEKVVAAQRERPAKATDQPANEFAADDIPFATNRSTF